MKPNNNKKIKIVFSFNVSDSTSNVWPDSLRLGSSRTTKWLGLLSVCVDIERPAEQVRLFLISQVQSVLMEQVLQTEIDTVQVSMSGNPERPIQSSNFFIVMPFHKKKQQAKKSKFFVDEQFAKREKFQTFQIYLKKWFE